MKSYWPEEGSLEFGPLIVKLLQTKQHVGVTVRTFSLSKKTAQVSLPVCYHPGAPPKKWLSGTDS